MKHSMQLIRGLHNLPTLADACVATIGNFDGVHIGHQDILRRLVQRAATLDVPACVVVFEPQPMEFFRPNAAPPRLTTLREKLRIMREIGVDSVLCLPFNQRLCALSAQEFIQRILVQGLKVLHLEVGDDFRFGVGRSGDFATLLEAGERHDFSVENAVTVAYQGERVSSTRIRRLLEQGDLELARNLLGRPFSLSGRVIHGQHLGRQLKVPTANIQLRHNSPPLQGVYVVSCHLTDSERRGVANIGVRPTVQGDGKAHLEVHILDFDGDLYGQRLRVQFLHKLRDERRFESLDALKNAISNDMEAARAYWPDSPSTTKA